MTNPNICHGPLLESADYRGRFALEIQQDGNHFWSATVRHKTMRASTRTRSGVCFTGYLDAVSQAEAALNAMLVSA